MPRSIIVAHFADNHIDESSRWEECLRLHNWATDDLAARKARGEGPDLILFAGDLYDEEPTEEEQNAAERILTRCAAIAPVVIIRGNHDGRGWLQIFSRLETVHPIVVEEGCGVHVVAGVVVGCVSWPRKAELLAALKPASAEEGAALAQEALRAIFQGLGQEMAEHDGPRVLLAHAMVDDSVTSLGQPLVGRDMEVGLGDLALADADLVALGHVHKSQSWQRGDMHIIYPGSMKRTEYGETEDKGYVLTRFDHTERPRPWVVGAIDHVIVPATPMLLVSGTWDDRGMALDQVVSPSGAEIRLRYTVDSDRRAAARAAAKALETEWRAAGAVDVAVDPVVNPVSRARSEARLVAEAPSLREQIETLWGVRQMVLSAERRARLLDKLLLIVGPNAVSQREQIRGAVCFDRIAYRGFRGVDDRAIELSELQGPLVAFTGKNGSGKTMTLGMLYAALYRDVPTRGSLARLALQRDAQLEVDFTTSFGSFTVTHTIDGQTAKPEAVLVDRETGRPVYDDTLVSKLDRWVSDKLPRPEVMLAGMFAAQGASGLLGMEEGDRKPVILRLEGVERFEPWAKTARDRARDSKEAAKVAAARVADERARGMTVTAAEVRFVGAEEAVARATGMLERGAAFVARTQAAAEVCKEESRALADAQARRADLTRALDAARARLADLDKRIGNNRAVLAEADVLGAAVAELAAVTKREADLSVDVARAQAAEGAARLAEEQAVAEGGRARRGYDELRARGEAIGARLRTGKPEADAAAARVAPLQGEIATAEGTLATAAAEVERLRGVTLASAEDRIVGLRGGLRTIASGAADARGIATTTLAVDDGLVGAAAQTPSLLATARAGAADAERTVKRLRAELAQAEAKAARLPEFVGLDGERVQIQGKLAEAASAVTAAEQASRAAAETTRAAAGTTAELAAARKEAAQEKARLEPVAKRADHLATARGRIEELERERLAAEEETARADAAVGAVALPAVTPFDARAVAIARGEHETAVEAVRVAREHLAMHAREVEAARVSEAKAAELCAEQRAHEEETADWTLLGESLGRDGIQAMIVESAGADLTTLVNDLLHTCHGPRFSMRIDAAKRTADGKKEVEGCEIIVLDARDGSERPGETFSGGEKAFLSEALSLAVTMRQCRGLTGHTLIRDEPTSTLDADARKAYVAMMRRAAELTGASRILFVSHHDEEIALADSRVEFRAPTMASRAADDLSMNSAPRALPRYGSVEEASTSV